MSEFRIEKIRHPLEVTLASGQRMTGVVFLEPVARNHSGAQDPRELLNDDDAFFPLAVDDGLVLVAKDQVTLASYQVHADAAAIVPTMISVRLTLSDGALVEGAVEVEARSDADRLLDYLNAFGGRFLSVTVDRSTRCLVNRRMIAGVRQR